MTDEGAQCFHWSHPDYSSSVAEFARILKPGSTLAFIWNLESRNSARWVSQVRDVYEVYEQGQPQYHHGWWKAMFETSAYKVSRVDCVVVGISCVVLMLKTGQLPKS